jgi:hypothetical protein
MQTALPRGISRRPAFGDLEVRQDERSVGEALVGRWPAPRRKARAAGGVGVLRSRASHRPGLPALRVVLEDRYACEAPAGGSTLSENVALLGDGKGLVPTVPFVGPPSPGP